MHLQLSFICIAYPALIITYLGQAAWLLAFPDQVRLQSGLALQLPCDLDKHREAMAAPCFLQVSSTFYASIPYGDGEYCVMPPLHPLCQWKPPLPGLVAAHATVLCCVRLAHMLCMEPAGFYWVVFVFATAAACIASQAMISAVFSIVKQSVALGCFPSLTVVHFPSSKARTFLATKLCHDIPSRALAGCAHNAGGEAWC